MHDRYLQFIVSDIFKFQNDQYPDYFHELFCPVGQNSVITRPSHKKLKLPYLKTKLGAYPKLMWDLLLGIAFLII